VTDGWKVAVDWDRNGNFTTAGDDITALVKGGSAGSLEVSYGRDQNMALAPVASGRGSLTLDNSDRRFSPRNPYSPLYGKVLPARPVKITRTVGGVEYVVGVFHTDDTPIDPDPNTKTAGASLVDNIADFAGQTISTALYSGVRTGEAIGYILDAAGWPTALRDIDPGATVIPWFWVDNKDALAALDEVVRSEGPPAGLWVGIDGSIVFRDRHHRLVRSDSITPQLVFSGFPEVEPTMGREFTYSENWSGIVNSGTVSVDVRVPQGLQTVWSSEATFNLAAGEQRVVTASGSDPFYDAVTPVAGIDYTTRGAVITTLLSPRNSGASVSIVLTAVAGATVVDGLRLRAFPVPVGYTQQVSASHVQSVANYGPRAPLSDLPWCGVGEAQSILRQTIAQRALPLAVVNAKFVVGTNVPRAQLVLPLDLSTRVTVWEQETTLSDDFCIENISHTSTINEDHAVTFGLEMAPSEVPPVARAGTAVAGTNRAARGLNDASSVLIVGSNVAGHRVGEGVAAA
jgi:hypothetical protein